jgi:hypothetical protein
LVVLGAGSSRRCVAVAMRSAMGTL